MILVALCGLLVSEVAQPHLLTTFVVPFDVRD